MLDDNDFRRNSLPKNNSTYSLNYGNKIGGKSVSIAGGGVPIQIQKANNNPRQRQAVNVFSQMQKNIKMNKAPVSQYYGSTPGLYSSKSLDLKKGLMGSSSQHNLVSKHVAEHSRYNYQSAYKNSGDTRQDEYESRKESMAAKAKAEQRKRLVGKMPSYEEYQNGRINDYEMAIEARRKQIRERPENQVHEAKIHHWNQVFKYQRDRFKDPEHNKSIDGDLVLKDFYKSPVKERQRYLKPQESYSTVKQAAQNDLQDLMREDATMKKRAQVLGETGCKLGGINKSEKFVGVSQSNLHQKLNIPTQFLPLDQRPLVPRVDETEYQEQLRRDRIRANRHAQHQLQKQRNIYNSLASIQGSQSQRNLSLLGGDSYTKTEVNRSTEDLHDLAQLRQSPNKKNKADLLNQYSSLPSIAGPTNAETNLSQDEMSMFSPNKSLNDQVVSAYQTGPQSTTGQKAGKVIPSKHSKRYKEDQEWLKNNREEHYRKNTQKAILAKRDWEKQNFPPSIIETLVEKELENYNKNKEGSLERYTLGKRAYDYQKSLNQVFDDRMTQFNSEERKNERLKYLQCWDMITEIRDCDPAKTDIRKYNMIVAQTMDLLIRKERYRQMLLAEQKKESLEGQEMKMQLDRKIRYRYLEQFRDKGGRFDIGHILKSKAGKFWRQEEDTRVRQGKRMGFLTKALQKKGMPFVVWPSQKLLDEVNLENLDGEQATLLGLEMFLTDIKFEQQINEEEEKLEVWNNQLWCSSSGESLYEYEDKQDKDKLTTGHDAIQNAYIKQRNARKIISTNNNNDKPNKTSPLVNFFGEAEKRHLAPKSMGFVHKDISGKGQDTPQQLNVADQYLRDDYVEAIAAGLDGAPVLRDINLSGVGLTDEKGLKILKKLNKVYIESLDLSNNPLLTKKFYRRLGEFCGMRDGSLKKLNLDGNRIGDDVLVYLVDQFINSYRIEYLNVSKCEISDFGARSLAKLIFEVKTLKALYCAYNRIMGRGGAEIARAIKEDDYLQILDVGYNSVCGGRSKQGQKVGYPQRNEKKLPIIPEAEEEEQMRIQKLLATDSDGNLDLELLADNLKELKDEPEKSDTEEQKQPNQMVLPLAMSAQDKKMYEMSNWSRFWSEAFAQNKSLIHVNLQHNNLTVDDVKELAEGLKENHTILGFHFKGNDGDIDSRGFMHDRLSELQVQNSIVFQMPSDMKSGRFSDSRFRELQVTSNCWVCEGWTQVVFEYTVGVSDNTTEKPDPFKPINLHLELDEFEPDLMLPESEGSHKYICPRMLPPGTHRYFFTYLNKMRIANDQPQSEEQPKPLDRQQKKKYLDLSRHLTEEQAAEEAKKKAIEEKKRAAIAAKTMTLEEKIKLKMAAFLKNKALNEDIAEELADYVDYMNIDIPKINVITVERTQELYNNARIQSMMALPRADKALGVQGKRTEEWDFKLSCFREYKPDNDDILRKCFDNDWPHTKIEKLIGNKNPDDITTLRFFIRSHYKGMRECFKYYAGQNPTGSLPTIGALLWTDICQNDLGNLIDEKTLKLAAVDLVFISTNAGKSSKQNPSSQLVRHNMMEAFVRLADKKYTANGITENYTQALKLFYEEYLNKFFEPFDAHAWRKKTLWNMEADLALKHGMQTLKECYKKHIGRDAKPSTPMFMSLKEFEDLMTKADIFSDNIGAKQMSFHYYLAMQTQTDEIENDKHMNMIFTEFIEAVGRVAQHLEIPHPIDDIEDIEGEGGITPELRAKYGARPLHEKIEAMLFTFAKNVCGPAAFKRHEGTVNQYKKAKLHANHIETGTLMLNTRK